MATGHIYYAEVTTPPAPVGIIYYAQFSIPEGVTGRIYHAQLTTPAGNLATGRIYHAELVTPAAPDAAAPSGVRQLGSGGAWWNTALRQRTSEGEWD